MYHIPWFPDADIAAFPALDAHQHEPDGLVAVGGNLSVRTLLTAYGNGIFPWFDQGQSIMWWSPLQRAVIATKAIHISKNLKKLLNRNDYQISADCDFNAVICACANRPTTWISEAMQQAYQQLFTQGIAHCIEVRNTKKQLVGGLYGVFVRNCFCGESMFSCEANTSKIALVKLAAFLRKYKCSWIDCQLPSAHLRSLGAITWSREQFIDTLTNMDDNPELERRSWRRQWQL